MLNRKHTYLPIIFIVLVTLLATLLGACGTAGEATQTPTSQAAESPTAVAETSTPEPRATESTATAVAETQTATATATTPSPTETATAEATATQAAERTGEKDVILATTTSVQDTGLLDVMVADFAEKTGYLIKPISVGTGQALQLGEDGNADVLFVHAPSSEMEFMDAGHGVDRRLVAHNYFLLVGPKDDPAGAKGMTTIEALKAIAASESLFISRGDDSGTHKKELSLWKKAEVEPGGAWYQETGQGMGATIKIASEKGGYTLTDKATWLSLKSALDLDLMIEGDPDFLNIYSVIIVNPDKNSAINYEGAKAFADYITSPETQEMMGEFGVEEFGEPLFFPDAGKSYDEVGK